MRENAIQGSPYQILYYCLYQTDNVEVFSPDFKENHLFNFFHVIHLSGFWGVAAFSAKSVVTVAMW